MMAGLVVLLLAGVYALSNVVEPWLAALIVGLLAMVVGFMMVKAGQKKFEADSLKPQHTINSLQKDKNAIGGRMS
jgi:cell division protein FtsN